MSFNLSTSSVVPRLLRFLLQSTKVPTSRPPFPSMPASLSSARANPHSSLSLRLLRNVGARTRGRSRVIRRAPRETALALWACFLRILRTWLVGPSVDPALPVVPEVVSGEDLRDQNIVFQTVLPWSRLYHSGYAP
ncbi:hypothetical protein BDM02DRAFT_1842269 [Thelephora ganbajun]|uniref:Uncharacterized protein n=1 Tax=Thelephora ganbajun TaxID=370292 RepID=A0ACB6Z003_THEGA|nr:hypothetical protein BDM02DRAFT_1842269 [Thelephora ganbajun]